MNSKERDRAFIRDVCIRVLNMVSLETDDGSDVPTNIQVLVSARQIARLLDCMEHQPDDPIGAYDTCKSFDDALVSGVDSFAAKHPTKEASDGTKTT